MQVNRQEHAALAAAQAPRLNLYAPIHKAMRAMIIAFRQQPQASRVLLSDQVLVAEGLCMAAAGHDNHAHFEVKPPPRIPA